MPMFWAKSKTGKILEGGLHLLDGAIGFGLISGAAVVVALGQFFLGGLLAVLALGIFVRMKRRKTIAETSNTSDVS